MAKGKRKLEVVHLACQETGDLNYTLRRKSGGEKLKVQKYSPRLRKHTLHVEKKKERGGAALGLPPGPRPQPRSSGVSAWDDQV